jgi:hypothetical protein
MTSDGLRGGVLLLSCVVLELDELEVGREAEAKDGSCMSPPFEVVVAPIDLGAKIGDSMRFCDFECRLCCCDVDFRIPADDNVATVAFGFVRLG